MVLGSRVYGLGTIGLGVAALVFDRFAAAWLPVPAHLPFYHGLAYASAALLILAGLAVCVTRLAVVGGLVLALFFILTMLALHLPAALVHPTAWGGWQPVAESTAMAMGGVLAALLAGAGRPAGAGLRAVMLVFGVCLLIFGVSHFVYAKYTASLVPGWLPPSRLFWAYATGVAQFAAGLAMLSGIWARPAAVLLTAMYVGFGLLVHLPLVIAAPGSLEVWSENFINLTLVGAAWGLAEAQARRR